MLQIRKIIDPKYLLKILVIGIVYYFAARLGFTLAGDVKQVSLVWPAAGISVFSLLVFGLETWPAIAIASLLANLTSYEASPFIALGITLGDTFQAYFAAYFLKRFKLDIELDHVGDVMLFIAFSPLLGTMLGAVIDVSSIILGGVASWQNFPQLWLSRWMGGALGSLVIAPYLLVRSDVKKYLRQISIQSAIQTVFLTSLLTFICLLLFTPVLGTSFFRFPFEYAIFPILILTAFQFRQVGSTWKILLVSVIAIWGTVASCGPFAACGDFQMSLLYLQTFIAITAVTFLIFSALVVEREKGLEEVRKNEERFRALIENSSDAVVLVDPKGTIKYASPSMGRMLGYEISELVNASGFNIIFPGDRQKSKVALDKLMLKPGGREVLQNRLVDKTGGVHWMEAIGTNLLNNSSVGAIVINFRDITEHKRIDEVRSEFVSMTAHELRGPLASIRWYTEALESVKFSPVDKGKEYLNEIHTSILNMASLVNLLLNVTKVELGTMAYRPENVDLIYLTNEVIHSFKGEIDLKKIKIKTNFSPSKIEMFIDRNVARIIIENLINNAVKYTLNEGIVDVSIQKSDGFVNITVKDNGIGIPMSQKDKIFTKLFRADNVKKRYPEGTGLGLYLTKAVVQRLNGKINFESTEGKGTTFYVTLPITKK